MRDDDVVDVDSSTPPADRQEMLDWLDARQEQIAVDYATAVAKIITDRASAAVASLTAAIDPSVFDGVGSELAAQAAKASAAVADTYLSGALWAWIRTDGVTIPDDVAATWAAVLNEAATDDLLYVSNRIVGATDAMWAEVRDSIASLVGRPDAMPADIYTEVQAIGDYSARRTETIVRTETVGAYNRGQQRAAGALVELGYGPTRKEWLATGDARTRPDHIEANGQIVPFDEPFIVGGVPMTGPHDPAAPPSLTVNCRCTILFHYDETSPPPSLDE
jgi:hypothetical protein